MFCEQLMRDVAVVALSTLHVHKDRRLGIINFHLALSFSLALPQFARQTTFS